MTTMSCGQSVAPGGDRKERSAGIAVIHRKMRSLHVFSLIRAEVQKDRVCAEHTLRKWYSRRESNPQRPLRRGLLYPFNYGSIFFFIPDASAAVAPPVSVGYKPAPKRVPPRLSAVLCPLLNHRRPCRCSQFCPFNHGIERV